MTNSFKSVSDIPALLCFPSCLVTHNTPCVLETACPTIPGFYSSICPATLCWAGSLEWPSQIVSAFTLLCLPQRIHVVNAQKVCKTLTCHNQFLSRTKSKIHGMEAVKSGLPLTAPWTVLWQLGASLPWGHIRHMCFGEQEDPGLILAAAAGSSHGRSVWPSWERVPAWLKGLLRARCRFPWPNSMSCMACAARMWHHAWLGAPQGHKRALRLCYPLKAQSETIWQALCVFANEHFTSWKVFLPSSVSVHGADRSIFMAVLPSWNATASSWCQAPNYCGQVFQREVWKLLLLRKPFPFSQQEKNISKLWMCICKHTLVHAHIFPLQFFSPGSYPQWHSQSTHMKCLEILMGVWVSSLSPLLHANLSQAENFKEESDRKKLTETLNRNLNQHIAKSCKQKPVSKPALLLWHHVTLITARLT